MHIPPLDLNTIIIGLIVVGALYGLAFGKFHLRLLVLSIYVGIVLAEQLSGLVRPYLNQLSSEQVSWLLLGAPIVVFACIPRGKSHGGHGADHGAAIANLLVGLLAGALIAAGSLHVLPTSALAAANQDSFLADQLNLAYFWLLGLLPVAVLALTLHNPKSKGHH